MVLLCDINTGIGMNGEGNDWEEQILCHLSLSHVFWSLLIQHIAKWSERSRRFDGNIFKLFQPNLQNVIDYVQSLNLYCLER